MKLDVTKENALLLELCKIGNWQQDLIRCVCSDPGLNFPYLLGQIQYNRLGGVAYEAFRQTGILEHMNREFRNTLTETYRQNKIKTESFCLAEAQLARLFSGADFPYAFLKGAYLVQMYPLGMRTSNDYDVLLQPGSVAAAEQLLKEAGFAQGDVKTGVFRPASRSEIISSRMNRGETVPWIKQVDLPGQKYVEIDLNFSLDFQAKGQSGLVAAMLQNAQPLVETAGGLLYTLAPADFLLHLCCHLYKEATVVNWVKMGRDQCLYKFVDIYLFLTSCLNPDLADALAAQAGTCHLEEACYYALHYAAELFGMSDPLLENLLHQIKPADERILRRIVDPSTQKSYLFQEEFQDWVFLPDRMERLKEEER